MKKILCLLMTVLLLISAGASAETAKSPVSSEKRQVLAVAELPDFQWQKTAAFPDWKGYTDDTLAMNSMLSFQFWHGQGVLWLRVSDQVESFTLYVNGARCDTSAAGPGIWSLDISGLAVDGLNTLQVSNILPLGLKEAVTVYIPYPEILEGENCLQGIQPGTLQLLSDLIASDVEYGFTGAQLAVVRNGRLVYENAWGSVNSYEPDGTPKADPVPVTAETMFDLASVTKIYSVTYAIQKLVTDGQLDIDTPIVEILGDGFAEDTLDLRYRDSADHPDLETQKEWKRKLTVGDFLRHQAGFPSSIHYYAPLLDLSLFAGGASLSDLYAVTREDTLTSIFKSPLLYEPGSKTVYSDLDFMLLTYVVEKVTGKRLDAYMKETFYAPLGLDRVTFLPVENGFSADDCAATELNGNTRDGHVFFSGIRTKTLQGQVHDEKAWYCMGGVSGHAGLFASATDLAILSSVMLTGGYGEHRFFSRDVIDLFTGPKSSGLGQWGLGWWREGDDKRVWYFGTQSSSGTVGHQGWTGTLAMIDPSRDLVVVYLTNKINSRITDPSKNQNGFDGSCYTASTLGFVPQILSIGMDRDTDISGQLLDLLADMATESLKKIPEGAGANHPYVRNTKSKISVLRKWAFSSGSEEMLLFADTIEAMLPRI